MLRVMIIVKFLSMLQVLEWVLMMTGYERDAVEIGVFVNP